MMRILLVAVLVSTLSVSGVLAQMTMTGVGPGSFGGGGGGTGHDLLANTGQPIYSTGTTPILVQ